MDINNIIEENKGLIYSVANYFRNYNSREDLYQAGCLGLIEALKNYNPNMNTKFSTYAYSYILGEMKKLVREDKSIKISRQISKLNLKIEKAYILLSQKLMKEPTVSEIASYLEIPEFFVSEAILSTNKVKSLDESINSEGKDLTLIDIIGKKDNIDDLIFLKDSLKKLNQDEMTIINNRYINDYTQSETSKLLGISQVQVSRKEQKILKKIREKIVA
ncbi:MAG: sigma-70 family RNA polymerase sigma factor [bacterium]|nr:sigma-70 family RNA polymerase sigma factor [bacterium]